LLKKKPTLKKLKDKKSKLKWPKYKDKSMKKTELKLRKNKLHLKLKWQHQLRYSIWAQVGPPAELKHITKRRKRN
jgi:hypothetical protein